jgi:hypothetical protein
MSGRQNAEEGPPVTLIKFLLARIAEDEAVAQAAIRDEPVVADWVDGHPLMASDDGRWFSEPGDGYGSERVEGLGITIYDEGGHSSAQATHIARHNPARVLAECEAKRRIVEAVDAWWWDDWAKRTYDAVLRHLAEVYGDHPDYRDEWRP